jgi:hypothetical protein
VNQNLEIIRQEHEPFLNDLEALAVQALASGDWTEVYTHINQAITAKFTLGDCFESQEEYQETLSFISQLLNEKSAQKL